MIPIGAYAPRHLMSTNHNAPIDAVRMFKDVVSLDHIPGDRPPKLILCSP